jgi:hypothetical protein
MTGIHSPYNVIPGDRAKYADRRSGASISPYSCLTAFLLDLDLGSFDGRVRAHRVKTPNSATQTATKETADATRLNANAR